MENLSSKTGFFRAAPVIRQKKSGLVSGTGGPFDVKPGSIDPDPILDPGCPRSSGGVQSAAALRISIVIPFKLRKLDCKSFFHGYGMHCSEAEIVFAIWDLPVSYLNGNNILIPFYVTHGSGVLLIGNHLLHQSKMLGNENLLCIPPGVCNLSNSQLVFET